MCTICHMTSPESDTDPLDPIFRALANGWRRRILDLLRESPKSTGDLADALPDISRFAVMQHLKVLEEARLVVHERDGRQRINHLNPVPIQMIYERWVKAYEENWASALLGLKRHLEAPRLDASADEEAS